MGSSYDVQLSAKDVGVRDRLAEHTARATWHPPFPSAESGFRNKAKLAIGGTADRPTLGILDRSGSGIDLVHCGLYEPALADSFAPLAEFIRSAGLTPYSVPERRGELKFLIVTSSPDGELMVRFVLRSRALLARIQSRLPGLIGSLPALRVATVNLHPEHKAVLDGDTELALTDSDALPLTVNGIELSVGPRSFFQTNTTVAAALYRQGAQWLAGRPAGATWDLFCGVGGFALHVAAADRPVYGIEISDDAIENARRSGSARSPVHFHVGDAFDASRQLPRPTTVIVNPPRRGLGPELCAEIERVGPQTVLYSSCNPATLGRDLAALPSYAASEAQLFDMFPQTDHAETLVLLDRA